DLVAAVLVRDIKTEEPKYLHRLDKRVRVLVAVFQLCGDGNDFALHKIANGLRNHLLMFGQFNHNSVSSLMRRKNTKTQRHKEGRNTRSTKGTKSFGYLSCAFCASCVPSLFVSFRY